MGLARHVAALARAVGQALRTRIGINDPGAVQAWINLGGAPLQPLAAYRVRRVKRLGAGHYRFVFSNPFRDTAYGWIAHAQRTACPLPDASLRVLLVEKQSHWIEVACLTLGGAPAEPGEFTLTVWR